MAILARSLSGARQTPGLRLSHLRGFLRLLELPEGWSTLLLLYLAHLTIIWSVERAGYVSRLPNLGLVTALALLTGLVLAKLRGAEALLLTLGLLVGVPLVLSSVIPLTGVEGVYASWAALFARLGAWWEAARSGGFSTDPLPFALFLSLLAWFSGLVASWFTYRYGQPWLALAPSAVTLTINLSYLSRSFYNHLFSYLGLYLLFALLFLARLHIAKQLVRWRARGVAPSALPGIAGFFIQGIWVAGLLVSAAYLLPWPRTTAWFGSEVREILSQPWRDFEQEFNRVFASLRSPRSGPLHNFGQALPFQGSIAFGSEPVLRVAASDFGPSRVQGNVYDRYTSRGWLARQRPTVSMDELFAASPEPTPPYRQQALVSATIEMLQATSVLFSPGQPLQVNVPARAELARGEMLLGYFPLNQSAGLPLVDRLPALSPGEIRRYEGGFLYAPRSQEISYSPLLQEGGRALDRALQEEGLAGGMFYQEYPLYRSSSKEIVSLRTSRQLSQGKSYTVLAALSQASSLELRNAGADYPAWTQYYLQLPESLPQRVRDLAWEIAGSYDNPYDRAVALEEYLRTIPYSLSIQAPPPEVDGVAFFLFNQRKGYCDYYASAMAVMLRALNIPSRMLVGYVLTPQKGEATILGASEQDAHSWPEAFFPGYGWIAFEPTPIRSLISRAETSLFPGMGLQDAIVLGEGVDEMGEYEGLGRPQDEGWGSRIERLPLFAIGWATVAGIPALLVLAFLLSWWWGARGLSYPVQLYSQMVRLAWWLRIIPLRQQTPYEYGQRVMAAVPAASGAIRLLVDRYVEERFSRHRLDLQGQEELRLAWEEVRNQIFLRMLRWKEDRPAEQSS